VPDLKKPLFYVSGPEPMVEAIGEMLQQIGVPKKRIKQDWFPVIRRNERVSLWNDSAQSAESW